MPAPKGLRRINGFDLATPYRNQADKKAWRRFLSTVDVRTACRLCGIEHIPHSLAAAVNWRYLLKYLAQRFPGDLPVREALVLAIKERRPDPCCEKSQWWEAMKPAVSHLETFAFLYALGRIMPLRDALDAPGGQDQTPAWDAEDTAIVWPAPELMVDS